MNHIEAYEALSSSEKERYNLALYIYEGHKDAYGVKGRHYGLWTGVGFEVCPEWTTEALKAECDSIESAVVESINDDERREAAAVAAFEATVATAIEAGASDRDTAIRWVKSAWAEDGYDKWYGDEHLEYKLGVPFGFFGKLEAAA